MGLNLISLGGTNYAITGTMTAVDFDTANAAARESVTLPFQKFRLWRLQAHKTAGSALATETMLAKEDGSAGGTLQGPGVLAEATALDTDVDPAQPNTVDQNYEGVRCYAPDMTAANAGTTGQGRVFVYPGPDANTDNAYDVEILISEGWA